MISAVPPMMVDAVFDQLGEQINKGLRQGQGDGTTELEMRLAVKSGDMQMWAVHDDESVSAAMILSVTQHSTGRKIFVELLAGKNIDAWVGDLEALLMDYQKLVGAMCVEASCRRGLAKYLKGRGWKTKAVIMEAPK